MAKKRTGNPSPEQILASTPREEVGTSAYTASVKGDYSHETLRPRHTVAGDPAFQPGGGGRNPVIDENIGAAYIKSVKYGLNRPIDPAAGSTMQNAKVVPPRISREPGDFDSGSFEAGRQY